MTRACRSLTVRKDCNGVKSSRVESTVVGADAKTRRGTTPGGPYYEGIRGLLQQQRDSRTLDTHDRAAHRLCQYDVCEGMKIELLALPSAKRRPEISRLPVLSASTIARNTHNSHPQKTVTTVTAECIFMAVELSTENTVLDFWASVLSNPLQHLLHDHNCEIPSTLFVAK